MSSTPELPLATGRLRLSTRQDPVIVDPSPALLADTIDALAAAAPKRVDPDREALREGARSESDPLARPSALPTVSVLAREPVIDDAIGGFHDSARIAGLVESDLLDIRTLDRPQPNAACLGVDGGTVIVETDTGRYPIAANSLTRDRYEDVLTNAEPHRLRTPARHQVYGAFHERCGETVADDVLSALEVGPDPATDRLDARHRAYLVGARHGLHDHTLRRACEDGGLCSPATCTGIKRRVVDADLVDTERVDRPVGRPRQRLIATDRLAAEETDAWLESARAALEN